MLGDVAVEKEVAYRLLDAAGAALDLEVVGLARADRLRVQSLRRRQLRRWVLLQAGVGVVERRVADRVEAPAVTAAVQVEDVELLPADMNQPDLRRVGEVAAHDRRRRVAKRIRAVGVGLLLGVLEQAVPERLRPIVDGEGAGPVAAGDGVDQRLQCAALGRHGLAVVADLMEHQDGFAEGAGGGRAQLVARHGNPGRLDDGLPARRQGQSGGARVPVGGAGRFDDEGSEQPVVYCSAVAGAWVDVVRPFQPRVEWDCVAIGRRLTGRHCRARVGADVVARGRLVELQPIDVHAIVASRGVVGEVDLDAVAFVGADCQRLNRVVAEPDGHLLQRRLSGDGAQLGRERIHLAFGVVVAEAVDRNVDVECGDVEGLVHRPAGKAGGRRCPGGHRSDRGERRTQASGQSDDQHQTGPGHVANRTCSQLGQGRDRDADDQQQSEHGGRVSQQRQGAHHCAGVVPEDESKLAARADRDRRCARRCSDRRGAGWRKTTSAKSREKRRHGKHHEGQRVTEDGHRLVHNGNSVTGARAVGGVQPREPCRPGQCGHHGDEQVGGECVSRRLRSALERHDDRSSQCW